MRLIDADEYSKEMKTRQEAVEEAIKHPRKDVYYTDKEHWESVFCTFSEAKLTLDKMPTIDASLVVHGRWIGYPECLEYENAYSDDHIVCSACEECFSILENCAERFDYCPHCGTKMDLEGLDETSD